MPIQLYSSNDLSLLSIQLSNDLRDQKPGIFSCQYVVTQTQGMNNWLKVRLADAHGITANMQFMQPNDMIQQIYFWLHGTKRAPLSLDFVQWNLFHLLGSSNFITTFPFIAEYYGGNNIKRIALASKMADLFDQYQVYRPDTIQSWNTIQQGNEEAGDWQQWLWVRIRLQMEGSQKDKTELANDIQKALDYPVNQELIRKKIPLLSFFGVAVITPFYLKIFEQLSKFIDLHFYLINPSPEQYWLEDHSEEQIARITGRKHHRKISIDDYIPGNSLLLNWGKIIKDSFYLLFQNDKVINTMEIFSVNPAKNSRTLLKKIQEDIFNNAAPTSRNIILENDLKDGSLTVNSCFTPVREIEVLYNYLVELIDRKKEKLSPREIVVIVSDIDRYAPYIRAIFDNAPYKFPYSIADETIATGNNIFTTLQKILQFDAGNFKAEAVLELLESPYIRKRFGITDPDSIREYIRLAGIRFGWEGSREEETHSFSWSYGLDRMLLGLCIGGGFTYDNGIDVIEPLDTVEGLAGLELVRFRHFVEVLHFYVEERNISKSITGWTKYVQEVVEDLIFSNEEKDDEDFHKLVGYLERIVLVDIEQDEPISFDVFEHSFSKMLLHEKKAHAFWSGGITFCSLIPMRSIPFRVVAVLGMDFDLFPRKESRLSFSLLEQEQRRGDRNVKDNDKHLFLETLISARQYLYISYLGNDAQNGSIKPPSSLLDELLDYIIAGIPPPHTFKRENLIKRHPLHGFSQKYFDGSGLISYLNDEIYKSISAALGQPREIRKFEGLEIGLHELSSFFRDPFKFYLNKSLNLYYREEDTLIPDTELFELSNLEEWNVRDTLASLTFSDREKWRIKQAASGKLPLRNVGFVIMEQQSAQIAKFRTRVQQVINNELPSSLQVSVTIDQTQISGKLESVYGDRYIVVTTSSGINKTIAGAFVQYIAAIASGHTLSWCFIAENFEQNYIIPKGSVTMENANVLLSNFITQFKDGFTRCYPFYTALTQPEGLFSMLDACYEDFIGDIESRLSKSGQYKDYIVNDPYFLQIYKNGTLDKFWYEEYQLNMKAFFSTINSLIPDLLK